VSGREGTPPLRQEQCYRIRAVGPGIIERFPCGEVRIRKRRVGVKSDPGMQTHHASTPRASKTGA
jgi:hypothetical protein